MMLRHLERHEWPEYFETLRQRVQSSEVPLVARIEPVNDHAPLTSGGRYETLKDLAYESETNRLSATLRNKSIVIENLVEVWINEDEEGLPMWLALITDEGNKWFASIQPYDSSLLEENNMTGN